MRAPDHWQSTTHWLARVLTPVASLYASLTRTRTRMVVPQRASIPVVCVGNITAGGSGKTPVAIAIAKRLAALGEQPTFLTRGYGGRLSGPLIVDAEKSRAIDVGDEPLLLARSFPTVVSGDRPKGAELASHNGASALVMDDGFQNPSLHKDAGIVVIDAGAGLGNGLLIPAGPMRETPDDALARAHCLVVMGRGNAADEVISKARTRNLPVIAGTLAPSGDAEQWRGQQVLAFAGIGRPQKFFDTLVCVGADIRETQVFGDHHSFTDDEAQALLSRARDQGLALVTTEKDMARMSGAGHSGALAELRTHAHTLPVEVVFDDPDALDQVLKARINAASRAGDYKAF
ncbi:MAG: tetraacyldisaccharide 4'-kinase [Pseudomonadota bacterium]